MDQVSRGSAQFGADCRARWLAVSAVGCLQCQLLARMTISANGRQRLIGQIEIGAGAAGIAGVDPGKAFAAGEAAQLRGGDRIVGRARQPFAAADLRLQRFGTRAQGRQAWSARS